MRVTDYFGVPAGVLGYLDWISGVLRVGGSAQRWERCRLGMDLTDSERALSSTITHESFHFFQIASCGYTYRFACQYFDAYRQIIQHCLGDEPTSDGLLSLIASPPAVPSAALALEAPLVRRGIGNLNVIDIVESAALLYEHRAHDPSLSHSRYRSILDGAFDFRSEPDLRCYRAAYDFLEDLLTAESVSPTRTFDVFLVCACAALCCDDPVASIEPIGRMLGTSGFTPEESNIFECLRTMSETLENEVAFIGTAVDVGQIHAELPWHPVFSSAMKSLDQNDTTAGPLELVSLPHLRETRLYEKVVQPVLFDDGHVWCPSAWRDQQSPERGYDDLEAMMWIGAVAISMNAMRRFRLVPFREQRAG